MKKKNLMLVSALCVCTLLNGCSKSNQKDTNVTTPTVEATPAIEATTVPEATETPVSDDNETPADKTPDTETPANDDQQAQNIDQTAELSEASIEAVKLFDSYIERTSVDTSAVKPEEKETLHNAKTTSKQYEKFNGEWNRTDCDNGYCGTLTIKNADENGFDVCGNFFWYSHSGVLTDSKGYFISDTKAVVEYSDPELGGDALVLIDLEQDNLVLIGIGGENFMFGANVSLDGTYKLGDPVYTNANIMDETFTKEEQKKVTDLLTKSNVSSDDYFVSPVEYGIVESSDVTVVFKDKSCKGGKWVSVFWPSMGGYDVELFIAEDGHIYYTNSTTGFFTDDKKVKEMPVKSEEN